MSYIYIRNKGGLGNQLFIFNFGLLLSRKYQKKLIIDNSTGFFFDKYSRKPILNKLFSKPIFEASFLQKFYFIIFKKLPKKCRKIFKIEYIIEQNTSSFINIEDQLHFPFKYLYVEGYFQSFQYLSENILQIQNLFSKTIDFNEIYFNYNNIINTTNSVCVHIRREAYDNLLSDLHYFNAIEIIKSKTLNPTFFIFSDSMEWCKKHFTGLDNIIFIENKNNIDDIQEFFLMKNCNHFIIANSTFSWWAAILSNKKYKLVIAPEKNQLGVIETFYPNDWMLI